MSELLLDVKCSWTHVADVGCLADITGAAACARKFINNTGSQEFRNGIFFWH